MRIELLTLKSKPLKEQIRIIDSLLVQYPKLGDDVREIIAAILKSKVFSIKISQNSAVIARTAILALAESDIASIPDRMTREPYLRTFEQLCKHFSVDLDDISRMMDYVSQIELLIAENTVED